ncbi:MAG: phage tail protein [Bacteroidota bacterium]
MELLTKFRFEVDWGGTKIGFSEVSGLNVETEVIEYRNGVTPGDTKIKKAGLKKYANITMKRGMFESDNEYFNWWKETFEREYKRDITIKLLNESGDPVVSWSVSQAWPVKIDATDLKADGNEVAVESMELAHEGIVMDVH